MTFILDSSLITSSAAVSIGEPTLQSLLKLYLMQVGIMFVCILYPYVGLLC